MSTLTINNSLLSQMGCGNYYVSLNNPSPGQTLDISYVDCSGNNMSYSIQDDGSNQTTLSDNICAKKDTIITNGIYILQEELECQSPISGAFYVIDDLFRCDGRGDGPTNWDCECSGNAGFNISQLTGVNYGIIQFGNWLNSSSSYLQVNGVPKNPGDTFSITDDLSSPVSYNIQSNNYPNCSSSYSIDFIFKHSLDGGITWGQDFIVTVSGSY